MSHPRDCACCHTVQEVCQREFWYRGVWHYCVRRKNHPKDCMGLDRDTAPVWDTGRKPQPTGRKPEVGDVG